MGNLENLKPFQPGVSGNPKGRPRKAPEIADAIDEMLAEKETLTAILKQHVRQAKAGDHRSTDLLLSYRYGKPKQSIEHTGEDGQPIAYTVVVQPPGNVELNTDAG